MSEAQIRNRWIDASLLTPEGDSEALNAIADRVKHKFYGDGQDARVYQALCLAEEVGEAVQALRRYVGAARQTVPRSVVASEVADVIISAQVLARLIDVDLDAEVSKKLAVIEDRGGL